MRVLVACERSGVVRRAFRRRGHEAWSCDLEASDDESSWHIQGDVLEILGDGWDLMIGHPPCTDLAVSGARWFEEKGGERIEGSLRFARALLFERRIPRVCIENPVGLLGSRVMPATQIVQPWMFGHPETKATCLWLRCLPELQPTQVVKPWMESIYRMSDSAERQRRRSRTFEGLAEAMAAQWG